MSLFLVLFTYGSTTGVQITWSICCAPVASITSLIKPEGNSAGLAAFVPVPSRKVLVHRIALAMDALLFRHGGLEAGALFGDVCQFTERRCASSTPQA